MTDNDTDLTDPHGEAAALRRQIADMQSKMQKQRNEIGRLTREAEQLRADKATLRFDLHKARARADQLDAVAKGGIA